MHKFKQLSVWQTARVLVKDIYLVTRNFPDTERFGLISQMNRSVVSIPSNIAEGCGRKTEKDFKYFLFVAKGSCNELETQVILANDLKLLNNEEFELLEGKIIEIGKMLSSLIRTLDK